MGLIYPNVPYSVKLNPFTSILGFPCQVPSWGDIVGIDLHDARIIWKHHNGTTRDSISIVPLSFPIGVPVMGGPIATAGGVVFLSGTTDQYLRVYNITTGKEIWKVRLPAGGQATPMTYLANDGKQYVAVIVCGHGVI